MIKRPKRQGLRAVLVGLRDHHGHIESMRLAVEVEGEESEQHQNAAEKRVEKKLDGGIFASRPAPDADEEVHGQQHEFPENVEEEKIQGDEYAHHAGIQQEEERKVSFDRLVNSPGGEDAKEAQERR